VSNFDSTSKVFKPYLSPFGTHLIATSVKEIADGTSGLTALDAEACSAGGNVSAEAASFAAPDSGIAAGAGGVGRAAGTSESTAEPDARALLTEGRSMPSSIPSGGVEAGVGWVESGFADAWAVGDSILSS